MLLALAPLLFCNAQEPELDPFKNWDNLVDEARSALEEFSDEELHDLVFRLSPAEEVSRVAEGNRLIRHLADEEISDELLPKFDPQAISGVLANDGTVYIADTAFNFQLTLSDTTQATLDDALFAVLIHEGAHALADRQYDAEAMFVEAGKKGVDALLAANSISEGWAQFVMFELCSKAKRSSHSLSEAGFRAEARWFAEQELARQGEDVAALGDVWMESLLDLGTEQDLYPYVEGERFVRRVLQERGLESASQLFREPPRTLGEIRNPEWYLNPSSQPELQVDTAAAESILLEELSWSGRPQSKRSRLDPKSFVAQFAPKATKAHEPYSESNHSVLWHGGYDPESATQFALAWIFSDSTASSLRTLQFHVKALGSLLEDERWEESGVWPDVDFGFAGGLNIVHLFVDDNLGEGRLEHHLLLVQRDRVNLVLALRRPDLSRDELFTLAARMIRVATCPSDGQPIRVSPSIHDSIEEMEVPRIAMAPAPPPPEIFDEDEGEQIPPAILAYDATETDEGQLRTSSLYLIQPTSDYSSAWDIRPIKIRRDSAQQTFGAIGDLAWVRGRAGDRGFVTLRSDVPGVDYWRDRFDFEHEAVWRAPKDSPVRSIADLESAPAQNPSFDELFLLTEEHAQVWMADAIGEAPAELVVPGQEQWRGIDLEVTDIDRDGINDVFVACLRSKESSAIELLQRKVGEWKSSGSIQLNGEIQELLLAKLDPTAPHEIWAAIRPVENEALAIARWVLIDGRWERQTNEAVQGSRCHAMQVADSDCDGALEVIVATNTGIWSMRPTRFGWDTKPLHQDGVPFDAETMLAVLSNQDGSGSEVYSIPQDGQSLMRWGRDQDVQEFRYWSEPVLLLDPPKSVDWSPIPLFAASIQRKFHGLIALPPGLY